MKRHFLNEEVMVTRGVLFWGILFIAAAVSKQGGMWVLLACYSVIWALFVYLDWRDNRRAWKAIKERTNDNLTHPWED